MNGKGIFNLMIHLTILAILIIMPTVGSSQDTLLLTHEQAIRIALDESFTIKSYKKEREAMEYQFDFHKAQFKPRLDFNIFAPDWGESVKRVDRPDTLPVYNSIGSMRFGSNLEFTYVLPTGGNFALTSNIYHENIQNVIAQKNYQTLTRNQAFSNVSLSFNQPFFTKNELQENLNEAEYRYKQASARFTRKQMDIVYSVTKGFYRVYQASRQVEIAREQLKNSRKAYEIAKLKLNTGRIPENEVLIAEVEMEKNRANLSKLENTLAREKDNFKQLIGLDLNRMIKIQGEIAYDSFRVNLDTAIRKALQNRLELKERKLNIKLQEINVDEAQRMSEFKGNISAYLNLTGLGMTSDKSVSSRSLFESSFENFIERPPNYGIKLTFTLPVYDWGRSNARVQEEKVQLEKNRLQLNNERKTIRKEIMNTVRTVQETRERLKIMKKNLQAARKSYKISNMRFENGRISSQELAQQQERLSDVQLAYLDAFVTYKLAVADLKRKTMYDFERRKSYLPERNTVLSEY